MQRAAFGIETCAAAVARPQSTGQIGFHGGGASDLPAYQPSSDACRGDDVVVKGTEPALYLSQDIDRGLRRGQGPREQFEREAESSDRRAKLVDGVEVGGPLWLAAQDLAVRTLGLHTNNWIEGGIRPAGACGRCESLAESQRRSRFIERRIGRRSRSRASARTWRSRSRTSLAWSDAALWGEPVRRSHRRRSSASTSSSRVGARHRSIRRSSATSLSAFRESTLWPMPRMATPTRRRRRATRAPCTEAASPRRALRKSSSNPDALGSRAERQASAMGL